MGFLFINSINTTYERFMREHIVIFLYFLSMRSWIEHKKVPDS